MQIKYHYLNITLKPIAMCIIVSAYKKKKFLGFIIKFNSYITVLRAILLFSYGTLILYGFLYIIEDIYIEWTVYESSGAKILFVLVFDFISLMFMFTVRLISISVIFFSTNYIMREKYFRRFILLVLSFILSIIILILRPNRVSILLGWDGLGVTSYLLVVYYQRNKSYNAGIITALTNRLGDVGLLVCLALLIKRGSWNFFNYLRRSSIELVIIILIFARITKSAQMPFSAWLPAAMAAPTPVSALVHSSTLVTAGVYLLIRFNHILISLDQLKYLIFVGMFTIFIAGLRANHELDIKKVIALSTLRQLGAIIIIIGAGYPLIGFFHLTVHAFFKALLFMCAGMIIHNFKDYQDIRIMSTIQNYMPLTLRVFITSNIRLCGLPFMAGFYSKDLILEFIIIRGINIFLFLIIVVSTALTVIYSCRLVFMLRSNFFVFEPLSGIEDYDTIIVLRFLFLFSPSIFGGLARRWIYYPSPQVIFFPFVLKILISLVVISRAIIIIKQLLNIDRAKKIRLVSWFNSKMWFLPLVISGFLSLGFFKKRKILAKIRESGWNEILLYNDLYQLLNKYSSFIEKLVIVIFSKRVIFLFIIVILYSL